MSKGVNFDLFEYLFAICQRKSDTPPNEHLANIAVFEKVVFYLLEFGFFCQKEFILRFWMVKYSVCVYSAWKIQQNGK